MSVVCIIMRKKKAPIYKLFHRKATKTQQIFFAITDMWEKPAEIFYCATRTSTLACIRNKFANLGSFAKISVPVGSIIPCTNTINLELSIHRGDDYKKTIIPLFVDIAFSSFTVYLVWCWEMSYWLIELKHTLCCCEIIERKASA